jgi:hypothetical protein
MIFWDDCGMPMGFFSLVVDGWNDTDLSTNTNEGNLFQHVWMKVARMWIPSGKRLHNYGKSPFFMGKSTISMAIFNSYVKLPEDIKNCCWLISVVVGWLILWDIKHILAKKSGILTKTQA